MGRTTKRMDVWKRLGVFFAAVFAVAALLQGTVYRVMVAKTSISGVFQALKFEECEGTIVFTAKFGAGDTRAQKEQKPALFARKIGLVLPETARRVSYDGREELIYEKEAAGAHSILKRVWLTESQEEYLCAEITLTNAEADAVEELKRRMEQAAKKLGMEEITTTIEFVGRKRGEIPLAGKDRLTDAILQKLYAETSYEHRENDCYTVYGYTAAEGNYLTVGGKRVNVQTAIFYDRERDRTEVILASPIGLHQ